MKGVSSRGKEPVVMVITRKRSNGSVHRRQNTTKPRKNGKPSWYRADILLDPSEKEVMYIMSHLLDLGYAKELKYCSDEYIFEKTISVVGALPRIEDYDVENGERQTLQQKSASDLPMPKVTANIIRRVDLPKKKGDLTEEFVVNLEESRKLCSGLPSLSVAKQGTEDIDEPTKRFSNGRRLRNESEDINRPDAEESDSSTTQRRKSCRLLDLTRQHGNNRSVNEELQEEFVENGIPASTEESDASGEDTVDFAIVFDEHYFDEETGSPLVRDGRITRPIETSRRTKTIGLPMLPFCGEKCSVVYERKGWRWAGLPEYHSKPIPWKRYEYKESSSWYSWTEFEIKSSPGRGDGLFMLETTEGGFLIPYLGFPMSDGTWKGLKRSQKSIPKDPYGYVAYCDLDGPMKYVDGHPRRTKRGAVWIWPGPYVNQANTPAEVNAMIIRVTEEQYHSMPAYPKFGKEGISRSRLAIRLLRDLQKGEEVLVDYGWSCEDQNLRKCGFGYWYAQHRSEAEVCAFGENQEPQTHSSNNDTPYTTTSSLETWK